MSFYDNYGEKATKEAFWADRKLIHVWKKRLNGHLEALIPYSTKPTRVRRMNTEPGDRLNVGFHIDGVEKLLFR